MTTTETTEISAVDQVNHFFTTLLKLYLYCSENSVRISSHPSDFAEREIDYSPGSYLAYLDNEYDIPPFTLDDGNSTTSVHLQPSTLPFVHSHIVLLQTSREIQQEFADATKSAMVTVHNGNFALHCKFTASDTEDILSSSELESVKLHGIDHFMLTHNWEHYARILAEKLQYLIFCSTTAKFKKLRQTTMNSEMKSASYSLTWTKFPNEFHHIKSSSATTAATLYPY